MDEQELQQEGTQQHAAHPLIALDTAGEINGMKLYDEDTATLSRGGEVDSHFNLPLLNNKSRRVDLPAASAVQDLAAPTSFIKMEKNLASLGFFTPSSRRIKEQKVKRISLVKDVDGKRVEVTGEILPSALYGLPITADQDKYLALQEIITNTLESEGAVRNPVRFRSSELLRLLGRNTKTGKNYKEIREWFDVMLSTTIKSNGIVEVAGRKVYGSDGFHVFDRVVSVGTELDNGTIADANYIWLSTWQLENINNKNLLPIDFLTYLELTNRIAKALVPLLQIWLFATQKAGLFKKRYDDLCDLLTIQKYSTPSEILRQLRPSFDELKHFGYLEHWHVEKTSDGKAFKIVFFHGPKFRRDRRRRIEQKSQVDALVIIGQSETLGLRHPQPVRVEEDSESRPDTTDTPVEPIAEMLPTTISMPGEPGVQSGDTISNVLDELTTRGVIHSVAANLLESVPADRRDSIHDYIEYWDSAAEVGPGFLYELIKNGNPLPPSFVPRRVREARERGAAQDAQKRLVDDLLKRRFEEMCKAAIDRYLSEYSPEEFERRVLQKTQELMNHTDPTSQHEWDSPAANARMARTVVRNELSKEAPMPSFDEFSAQELTRILVELHLEPATQNVAS